MPAERTRPSLPSGADPTVTELGTPTYSEEEVGLILRRAARLEGERGTSAGGALTLAEIETIARDAGIEIALVREAALDLDLSRARGAGRALAGAPLRTTIERVVDGELTAEHHEVLAQEIRTWLSGSSGRGARVPVSISVIGQTLTASGFSGTTPLEITVGPRDGKTWIRISADRSHWVGGMIGGMVMMSPVAVALPNLLHLPIAAGVASAALVVGGAYGLARTLFTRATRSQDRRLVNLASRLEALVERATAPSRSLPAPG